jgi:hypothetical protein
VTKGSVKRPKAARIGFLMHTLEKFDCIASTIRSTNFKCSNAKIFYLPFSFFSRRVKMIKQLENGAAIRININELRKWRIAQENFLFFYFSRISIFLISGGETNKVNFTVFSFRRYA